MISEKQIVVLIQVGKYAKRIDLQKKAIDSLATYGQRGIAPILEIISDCSNEEIKKYGHQTLKIIIEKTKDEWRDV